MTTMRILLVALVLLVLVSLVNLGNARRSLSKEEDLELEQQLKTLVKPSVKTIHTKSGDIFDCVDIYKQPALDHPLLKNHKIQLTPNFAVEETTNDDKFHRPTNNIILARTELEIQGETCPTGFTPIRRTTKDDLIRAKYLHKPNFFSKKKNLIKPNSNYPYKDVPFESVSYLSNIESNPEREVHYYGGKATLTVHTLNVTANQFSSAQIAITSTRTDGDDNVIQAGWTAYPALFGDNKNRLFAYWTADGYNQTGCYNTLCPGFVQTSVGLGLGSTFSGASEYGGRVYGLIYIIKQAQNGDWWLMINDENFKIGYWPKSLFNLLSDDASFISYGGEAGAPSDEPLPPMGNGHFPTGSDLDLTREAYISSMKVISTRGGPFVDFATKFSGSSKSADSTCYNSKYYGLRGYRGRYLELTFGYGGPGGQCSH